ncbi:hypothetical protein T440DRAFT_555601 [Plenodomus tracheiphilus IPT5]|uniref:Uncharacterized protein n=1 Tax=Plenodomus tracheiphilus IPT5 TaxID=1408161 RepID=A0A6A7B6F2_9PLEO|nr:hypothetical protein T440DRAFT_555601 [Plenodomus tracheiphilus IPT5]
MARRLQMIAADDDHVNTENQQMIAVAQLFKQPRNDDKDMQQLRALIQAEQRVLKAVLDRRVGEAERQAVERRDEITSSIFKALSSPIQPAHREKTTIGGSKIADNTSYTSTTDVLAQSDSLVKEYKRLDDMIEDLRGKQTESVADTWKHDIGGTEEQLHKGARVAIRSVKRVLGADMENDEEDMMHADEDVGTQSGGEQELNYDLQKSLRYAERGIKRMAKALPFEKP